MVLCIFGAEVNHGCKEMLAAEETDLQKMRVFDERGRACLLCSTFFQVVELFEENNRIGVWASGLMLLVLRDEDTCRLLFLFVL
jgi:hypothetical protein